MIVMEVNEINDKNGIKTVWHPGHFQRYCNSFSLMEFHMNTKYTQAGKHKAGIYEILTHPGRLTYICVSAVN